MMACLAVLVGLNILAVLMARRCGGLLNLGANMNAERVAKALKICASELMELNTVDIGERCQSLNAMDLNALTSDARALAYTYNIPIVSIV